jgi:hypothetical protein
MRHYRVFAYESDGYLFCETCAEEAQLSAPRLVFQDAEFDQPEHCKSCGEFLENGLTAVGREFLIRAICNFEFELDPDRFDQYFNCYGNWSVIPTFAGVMNANGVLERVYPRRSIFR